MVDADDWSRRSRGSTGEIPRGGGLEPARRGARAIGGLTLSFDDPREFTPDDIGFMLGAARQGAQALERARWTMSASRGGAALAPGASRRSPRAVAGLPETLTAVVDLVVPRFADWATVELLEPNGSISTLAVAHVDPEKTATARSSASTGRRTCRRRTASGT